MKFIETPLPGVFVIEPEPLADERGSFARTFCREEFAARGLNPSVAQSSISRNGLRGTLRGLHYQVAPQAEAKLVRCAAGAIYDVIVDLRPGSPCHRRWLATDLTAGNRRMLYVPEGVAHGFQTLEDDTEVAYQISVPYHEGLQRGVRWDDPTLAVAWPIAAPIVGERDRALPYLAEVEA